MIKNKFTRQQLGTVGIVVNNAMSANLTPAPGIASGAVASKPIGQ